eukprot:12266579-Alexandrium_andersonii.AAC.1
MIAANFTARDRAWRGVRVSQAVLDTFALYGDVGSIALSRRPRQLDPAASVSLLAQSGPECRDARSWRV